MNIYDCIAFGYLAFVVFTFAVILLDPRTYRR